MAVEGEWAWPRCIGCGKRIDKKRPRDFRYGMDVCCAHCINKLWGYYAESRDTHRIAANLSQLKWRLESFQKSELHDEPVAEKLWQELGKEFALWWARLREHYQMPEFPAGLELFLVEIHNIRNVQGARS
jgi:hypothetical protein